MQKEIKRSTSITLLGTVFELKLICLNEMTANK